MNGPRPFDRLMACPGPEPGANGETWISHATIQFCTSLTGQEATQMIKRLNQRNRYLAFAAILFGVFLFIGDYGGILIAVPSVSDHFGSDVPTTQWVMIGYVLAISISLLPTGRLADLIGRKSVYVAGVGRIHAFRADRGAGANDSHSDIGQHPAWSRRRSLTGHDNGDVGRIVSCGRAGQGAWDLHGVVGVGTAFGPAAGGLVAGSLGWQWVFFGGALLGLVAIVFAMVFVDAGRTESEGDRPVRFDWVGTVLSGAALLAFLQAMTWAPRVGYGQPYLVLAFVAAAAMAVAFIVWELRTPSPLMDLRLFRDRVFRTGVSSGFIHFTALLSALFLMPFYLQTALRFSAGEVGLITALSYLAIPVVGPIAGRMFDRHGRRYFTVGGMLLTTAGILTLSTLGPDSNVLIAVAGMFMQGIGIGAFIPPNNSAVLGTVSDTQHAAVSGFPNLMRNAASVTSIAIATAVVTMTMGSDGLRAEPGRGDGRRFGGAARGVRAGDAVRLFVDGWGGVCRSVRRFPGRRCRCCRRERR